MELYTSARCTKRRTMIRIVRPKLPANVCGIQIMNWGGGGESAFDGYVPSFWLSRQAVMVHIYTVINLNDLKIAIHVIHLCAKF